MSSRRGGPKIQWLQQKLWIASVQYHNFFCGEVFADKLA
jgi:hypothetical protein